MNQIKQESKSFWEKRGKICYLYKGEEFYTISAIPYYYKRRQILLSLMSQYVKQANKILDFGCGDGWYISYFSNNKGKEFCGVDISESMLQQAKKNNQGCSFSSFSELKEQSFDLVYIISVFAHIEDKNCMEILNKLSSCLKKGGKLLLFEQTAPIRYSGDNFVRRRTDDYIDMLKDEYRVIDYQVVCFKYHCFFERYIAKKWYGLFSRGKTDYERRIYANKSCLFRFLSDFFCRLSFHPVSKNKDMYGYSFIVVEKK